MMNPRDALEAKVNKELVERVARLRKVLDEGLGDLASLLPTKPTVVEASGAASTLAPVMRFLAVATSAGSQKEILAALLDVSATCYTRTVLFILRAGALVAWDARNMAGARGVNVGGVAHLTIPATGDHLPARALAARTLVTAGASGPGFLLTEALGGFAPVRSAAVPLVVRGRPVALLYGDSGPDDDTASESVFSVLGSIGSLSIEALGSARRGRTSGSARDAVDRVAGTQGSDEEGAMSAVQRSNTDGRAPVLRGFDDEGFSSPVGAGITTVSPPAPEEAEMQALLGDIEGMRRDASDDRLSPDDQRSQADARRFASLLISEILLYNEEAVILGRRNHDLSKRLGREIEKSRQAFATRVPGQLGGAGRYFEEELVRVLAEGDPTVLGN